MGKKSKNEPSIREIAAAADVSTATVSRVLNRHPHVSAEVRERVLSAARARGYAPTIASSSNLFGILLGSREDMTVSPYFNQVLRSLSHTLFLAGYDVQIFSRAQFPYILRNTFRGVAVFSESDGRFFQERQIPCVVVNNPFPEGYSVVTDHAEGLKIAVDHLLKLGHRKIAYLHSDPTQWGSRSRLEGYKRALLAAGLAFEERLHRDYSVDKDFENHLRSLLASSPTALIVEGENAGLPADHALKKLGVRIPEELSLITFESTACSQFLYPEHTTVCQDFASLGRCAAETLLLLALSPEKADTVPRIQILHNDLICRASCRALAEEELCPPPLPRNGEVS